MAPRDDRPLILLVEDEENIASFARMYLEAAGFRVAHAARGDDGLRMAQQERPALLVLDLMLPGIDGYEVTRRLRQIEGVGETPIIMLTARDEAVDRVVGLELGADDYLTKPFNPRELVARVRAVLRRSSGTPASAAASDAVVLEIETLRIEVGPREAYVDGASIALTPKEFDLLRALIEAHGRVLSREVLLDRVWGYARAGEIESRTVDVHVRRLRQKLGAEGRRIVTAKSVGYRFEEAD